MHRRQTNPQQWLIVNGGLDGKLGEVLSRLPRGTGILLLQRLPRDELRRLIIMARLRRHPLADETRGRSARIHSVRELTRALIRRPTLVLLSPMYPTSTHPGWRPLPLMRAATLARLCRRNAVALGGMTRKRYARVARLGFKGWAGITAFRI